MEEKRKNPASKCRICGGAYRIRTGDLYNANVARYQAPSTIAHGNIHDFRVNKQHFDSFYLFLSILCIFGGVSNVGGHLPETIYSDC